MTDVVRDAVVLTEERLREVRALAETARTNWWHIAAAINDLLARIDEMSARIAADAEDLAGYTAAMQTQMAIIVEQRKALQSIENRCELQRATIQRLTADLIEARRASGPAPALRALQ